MKIKKLKIKNYRNCEEIELDLNNPKILILGKNAQGKTNILECIYLISSLKSPRTSNNLELIKFNTEKTELFAEIEKAGVEIDVDFSYDQNKKREIKTNKLKTTPKEFRTVLKTVLFSTQDLLLLRGTPQNRRDWLDSAISQIYPAYDDRLSKYNKIKTQKNNFLKECNIDEMLLDVFNEQMVVLGSNIIYLRKKYLKEIEKIAQEKHCTISGTEKLTIKYENNFLEENSPQMLQEEQKSENDVKFEIDEISKKFQQKLKERRDLELIKKQSLVGPHRDDVIFKINGLDGTKFASQGQQRTIVLSLKLAELDMITQKIGESPVLLLDDVLAELDDLRQNYLLKTIQSNTQTIITSVDTLLFDEKFLSDVVQYKVENGQIVV